MAPLRPDPLPPLTLILGGARSGKSRHAERLVLASGMERFYVATAEPGDAEMAARIARHRVSRDARFSTIEVPLELAETLERAAAPDRALLVDCLTLWLTNLMLAGRDPEAESERLLAALPGLPGAVVLVSNEVGLGVVPADAMARAFVDHAGRLHQRLAEVADAVVFMVAGIPQLLKPEAE